MNKWLMSEIIDNWGVGSLRILPWRILRVKRVGALNPSILFHFLLLKGKRGRCPVDCGPGLRDAKPERKF
ncbi:MAG: hypothetical protein DRI54_03245, partial [Bacteroidetes bacterium]